jgi:hypothetical protein
MMPNHRIKIVFLHFVLLLSATALGTEPATLPNLRGDVPPRSFADMWSGFDPRQEPLEVETIREWEEDGVVLRIVRFRVGVFKGQVSRIAAVYGFPKAGSALPGLVQIHGGGQYADHKACLMNARRGYATVSIAWAGRISAPEYRVGPAEVKLFWAGKTEDPNYKLTTDWGAVDGYHAPGRNAGNQFPSVKPASWTIDTVDSPRNSGWFLCAMAARRALTFLEQQPEVEGDRLGVYGHSMGGKLTVLTAPDPRVKAAAPSCGGISDRDNASELFRATLGDDVSLQQISCPIVFLSPANDFHGRIGDLPKAVSEIKSDRWRVICAPHHNHQDTAAYEVASLLWFDQHLKQEFSWPRTPKTQLQLNSSGGVPAFTIEADTSQPIAAVDIFYTQHGKPNETSRSRDNTVHRFWHHVAAVKSNEDYWSGKLPVARIDRPLWVYANVTYDLPEPVEGAGYYYRPYVAKQFNLSSLLTVATPVELQAAGVQATLAKPNLIEDFADDWEKEWFTYNLDQWGRSTNKLYDRRDEAPSGAKLALDVRAEQNNKLVIRVDDFAAEVQLSGGNRWQQVALSPDDFQNLAGEGMVDWKNARQLTLTAATRLKPPRGGQQKSRVLGGNWRGPPPQFRNLRWLVGDPSNTAEE